MSSQSDGVWYGELGAVTTANEPNEAARLATPERHPLVYDGQLRDIYRIFFSNLVLIAASCGVYYFWGKVRLRQYLWSRMALDGHRFEFRGRGGEMFGGFLIVLAALFVWGLGTTVIEFMIDPDWFIWVAGAIGIVTFVVIFFLAFVAQFSAQRYRLTRTFWCGIGGGMRGSALIYALKAMGLMILVPLTLFQARPFVSLRLLEHRLNRVSIGDRPVSFAGCKAGDIYGRYLLSCLGVVALTLLLSTFLGVALYALRNALLIVLMGFGLEAVMSVASYLFFYIASAWVMAGFWSRYWNHVAVYVRCGPSTLEVRSTRKMFVRHRVVHTLAIFFSLGLAYPWALHRVMRFVAQSVTVTGDLATAELRQTTLSGAAIGEGLLNAFDPGFI